MQIRDRIKELRRVPANELRPNPKNWRTHPEKQLDALRGVLAEIGFAGAELARELPDGSLMLIDGHARAEVAGTAVVPVLVLDVDEAEADKILATFDPLGAMAGADTEKLDLLLRNVQTGNEALAQMLTDLSDVNKLLQEQKEQDETYTRKVEAPIYEPKNEKPKLVAMVDNEKTQQLASEINAANIDEESRALLLLAANRHTVFNYERIADFYAHSSEQVQRLMEKSALVIIDFDKAIEFGYTILSKELSALYKKDCVDE